MRFERLETGELSLPCADDGIGIPETLERQTAASLGLRIIQILAKQIAGTLVLHQRERGTHCKLKFLSS